MQNPAESIRFTCRENDSKARAFNALRYRSSLARAGVHKATSVLQSAPVALSEAISVSYKPLSRRRIAETILPLAAYWLSLPSVAHPQTDFTKIVGKHFDSPLAYELGRMLREMELGVTRRIALQNMKARIDVQDVSNFVLSLVQADALGMPIGRVLRTQAHEMRLRRRQWARRRR